MKPIRNLLLLLLVVGCIPSLTSCVYDDDDIPTASDTAITDGTHTSTFRITISAKESDTTRANSTVDNDSAQESDVYYDANAEQYEFMNSLAVFIVDNSEDSETKGRIMWKFCTNSSATTGSDAAVFGGNVVAWTSDDITLANGSYSIYAFSNWETVVSSDSSSDDPWQKIINKVEYNEESSSPSSDDYTLSEDDLTFYVDDPAKNIDLTSETKKFIPMSGQGTFTLGDDVSSSGDTSTVTNGSVSVALDRLVSKVTIGFMDIVNEASSDIQTDAAGVDGVVFSISNLSISGFADKVSLLSSSTPTGSDVVAPTYQTAYKVSSDAEPFTVKYTSSTPTKPTSSVTFYVNAVETEQSTGFAISFDAVSYEDGQSDGITDNISDVYTTTKKLDRNTILPIYITPTEYYATTSVKAYTAAIDGEEREYIYTADNANTFNILLYDVTTKVDITPLMMKASYESSSEDTSVNDVKYSWDDSQATGGVKIDDSDVSSTDGTLTLTMPTAYAGWSCTGISFTAEWTSSTGISHKRTYQVSLTMTDGMPTFPSNLPRWVGPWQLATPTVGNTTVPSGATATKVTASGNTTTVISPAATSYGEIIAIPLR